MPGRIGIAAPALSRLCQHRRLDVEREAVAALYCPLDFSGEGEDFRRRAAVVHQHQRVFGVDADFAVARAFESALFNQPGGGDFHRIRPGIYASTQPEEP